VEGCTRRTKPRVRCWRAGSGADEPFAVLSGLRCDRDSAAAVSDLPEVLLHWRTITRSPFRSFRESCRHCCHRARMTGRFLEGAAGQQGRRKDRSRPREQASAGAAWPRAWLAAAFAYASRAPAAPRPTRHRLLSPFRRPRLCRIHPSGWRGFSPAGRRPLAPHHPTPGGLAKSFPSERCNLGGR